MFGNIFSIIFIEGFPGGSMAKNLPANTELDMAEAT